jgi:hypothetical protein
MHKLTIKNINLILKKELTYFKKGINHITSFEKLNSSSSPDGSKYPFMPVFGIKDIADSGSEVDEKRNISAPKTKNTSLSTSVANELCQSLKL